MDNNHQGLKAAILVMDLQTSAGVSTSGVVLSTLREAADKDFHLSVLSDGCADPEAEVHTVLLSKAFPRQATVLTAAGWTAQIKP